MERKKDVLESEVDVKDVVVIDNGTESVKIGISGEDYPRIVMNTISGSQNIKTDSEGVNNKPMHLFGNSLKQAAIEKKHEIQYSYPIKRGVIEDLEVMRDMWENILEEYLQITEISNCNFLIIDNVNNSKNYKQKIAEILFEDIKVQSVLFMNSASLSLFSTGKTSGFVIESGHGLTSVTPIFEGYPIYHAIQSSELGGQDVTVELEKDLLKNPKFKIDGKNYLERLEIIKDIKEKLSEVADNYEEAVQSNFMGDEEEISYELPDGTVFQIDNQTKYRCSEILFNPQLINSTSFSITEMIEDSLSRCDVDLRTELYKGIIYCGGNSTTKNFSKRLTNEIYNILPENLSMEEIEIRADSLRKFSAWIGGSMLGSLKTFQNLAITKAEYDENPEGKMSIVHKRTF